MFLTSTNKNLIKLIISAFAGSLLIAFVVLLLVLDDTVSLNVNYFEDEVQDSLEFLHIIFRHGDRTPDRKDDYPKDPYINYTYPPYGLEQLTKNGKKTEYKLGQELKARYGTFLGSNFIPEKFSLITSDYTRTKMSLLLVMASLFPPNHENTWNDNLPWQPIPYDYTEYKKDYIFFSGYHCPNTIKEYRKVLQLKEVTDKLDEVKPALDVIHEVTGHDLYSNPSLAWGLYLTLKTQFEFGLELPESTKHFFPHPLHEIAVYQYTLLTYNTELKRLIAGNLMKKIVKDTEVNEKSAEKKLYLYSGHDMTLGGLLRILDVFDPHVPPYGAYLALEVHRIQGVLGFKVYYQDYNQEKLKLRVIPGCDEFCPIATFKKIVEPFYFYEEHCGNL